MKVLNQIVKCSLLAALTLSMAACGTKESAAETAQPQATAAEVQEVVEKPVYVDEAVNYAEKKEINDDYVGHFYFESGLIDELVVQANNNEKYFDLDFEGNYYSSGSVFMDYRNTLFDENIILYGHFVYADESKMFSPLHQLKDEANYEANQYLYFALEDEVRKYEVAYVYYYEMNNSDLEYFHPEYTTEQLAEYLAHVKSVEFYDTGVEITNMDHFLTLQTCVRDRDDLRLIVIAKQVD